MRQNAPWNDQTGNARNGLHTTTFHEVGGTHGIVCAHSMPYGIWLEVKFSGRDGIIPATVRNGGDALMTLLSKLFGDVIEVH